MKVGPGACKWLHKKRVTSFTNCEGDYTLSRTTEEQEVPSEGDRVIESIPLMAIGVILNCEMILLP